MDLGFDYNSYVSLFAKVIKFLEIMSKFLQIIPNSYILCTLTFFSKIGISCASNLEYGIKKKIVYIDEWIIWTTEDLEYGPIFELVLFLYWEQ